MLVLHNSLCLQFDGFIDLDSYDTIAMKLKGDGRCYISTVSALFRCQLCYARKSRGWGFKNFISGVMFWVFCLWWFSCRSTRRIGSIHLDRWKIIHGKLLFMCLKATGTLQR